MPGKILPFPSCRLTNVIRVEVVRPDRALGERSDFRHVRRTRSTTTALPVRPNLPHRTHAGSGSLKCKVLPFPPLAQGVLGSTVSHIHTSKPIAYCLTRPCKELHGSFVSADIVHFLPMNQAPNRIRALRNAAGISQEVLGERIGAHKMTVSDLERGKIELTLSYMRKVAAALNVSPAELLLDRDDPARPSDVERELLEAFRASPAAARDFLLASARAVAEADKIQAA